MSAGERSVDKADCGSGFATMSISEVFGEFRCGKTQLSHTMSVIAQLPKDLGGAEGKVAFIGEHAPCNTLSALLTIDRRYRGYL